VLQRDRSPIGPCECGGKRKRLKVADGAGPRAAHGDYIPGGITYKHGICNEDGTPRTFYSKREIRDAEKKAGVVNMMDSGAQLPVVSEEQDRFMSRPGFGQAPRRPAIPSCLTQKDVDDLHRRNRLELGLCVECGAFPGDCEHDPTFTFKIYTDARLIPIKKVGDYVINAETGEVIAEKLGVIKSE
jgi:hypothetical protein